MLRDGNVRCSVIGLAAEVCVCKKLCKETHGSYLKMKLYFYPSQSIQVTYCCLVFFVLGVLFVILVCGICRGRGTRIEKLMIPNPKGHTIWTQTKNFCIEKNLFSTSKHPDDKQSTRS